MSWNFVGMVEHGAGGDGMFPVPTGNDVGIAQLPGDGNATSFDLAELSVHRLIDGAWKQVYLSRGNPGTVVITDQRVAVVFKKAPKNSSMFVPLAMVQAIARAGQHRGESLVGHATYSEINSVAARNVANGFNACSAELRLVMFDGTVEPATRLQVCIGLVGRTRASDLADDILRRAVRYRLGDPVFAEEGDLQERWRQLAATPMAPPKKDFETRTFGPSRQVTAGDHRRSLAIHGGS